MTSMRVPAIFHYMVELALALGVQRICDLPGCWEHQVDSSWWLAFNGHEEAIACSHGPLVPPFTIYIEFNGWPGGFCDAGGGPLCGGAVANEDALIHALQTAAGRAA